MRSGPEPAATDYGTAKGLVSDGSVSVIITWPRDMDTEDDEADAA